MRPQNEPFTYDADGNLLADGLWDYRYNAADQLAEAVSKHKDQTGKRVLIRFTYDYMGRRAAKTVYDLDTGAQRTKTLFVYQGWTLIAEYSPGSAGVSPALTLQRTFTWGPDLTGGSGAGGIGGLLAIQDHRTAWKGVFNPAFDGNGNVTALVESTTGTIVASYEYDPYGNAVRSSGVYATENPIRFSTKYHDNETGLVYYGFRYYSPSMGRFINQDPLKEAGGINIYAFTSNNPINSWDAFGLTNGGYDTGDDDDEVVELPVFEVWGSRNDPDVWADQFSNYDFGYNFANFDLSEWNLGLDSFSSNLDINVLDNIIDREIYGNRRSASVSIGSATTLSYQDPETDQWVDLNNAPVSGVAYPGGRIYYSALRRGAESGRMIVYTDNMAEKNKGTATDKVNQALALLMKSPTFATAYNTIIKKFGLVINPVDYAQFGTVDGSNLVFGTAAGVRANGTIVFPAYVIAHELAHMFMPSDKAHKDWILPSNAETAPILASVKAPDPCEYYAYKFAEQVSKEVYEASGVNIGKCANYFDVGDYSKELGLIPQ